MICVLETLENLIQKYQFFNKENELKDLLYTFKCEKDLDLENFLHNKAIDFEKTKYMQDFCFNRYCKSTNNSLFFNSFKSLRV